MQPLRDLIKIEDDDADLVARVLSGDMRAKSTLYRKHVRYIGGMVTRLLRHHTESEDVVQDTFTIALSEIRTLRDASAFRGWLAQIAVSQVRRKLRRRRLLAALGLDSGLPDAPLASMARHDTSVEVRSELVALDRVLYHLPPSQRIAWMLRHVEGESLEDVARACDCSLATAKRWISNADTCVRAHVKFEEPRT